MSKKRPPVSRSLSNEHAESHTPSRAILVAAYDPHATSDGEGDELDPDAARTRSLDELELLVRGLGFTVTHRVVQRRAGPSQSYLGDGKLRELALLTGGPGEIVRGKEEPTPSTDPDPPLVVVDDELSPTEERRLTHALGVTVIDRAAVILRVFEKRARTREAMAEVELAQLAHALPRIRDDHTKSDREGGGGRASRGHSNVELAKQRAKERMADLRRELDAIFETVGRRRATRSEQFTVALVGYTNAGKSSLMRALTGSDVLVEDKLFATLGTTVRALSPPTSPPVLVVDTVGFIHRLPHGLIASFRATLAEANSAWLHLVVADASDSSLALQLSVTDRVLDEIGTNDIPRVVVLNKADLLTDDARAALELRYPDAALVSALDAESVRTLRARIESHVASELVEQHFTIPYADLALFADLRARVQVLSEVFDDEAVKFTVRGRAKDLERFTTRVTRARE
jgi:GTP-binding protein HflX